MLVVVRSYQRGAVLVVACTCQPRVKRQQKSGFVLPKQCMQHKSVCLQRFTSPLEAPVSHSQFLIARQCSHQCLPACADM